MKWRIYRLPGSQKIWHIDSGPGTPVINVRGFETRAEVVSVDSPNQHPRAWLEISGNELLGNVSVFVVGNVAQFLYDVNTLLPCMTVAKEGQ